MEPDSIMKIDEVNVVRQPHLAEKIVFVDGLGGCGKTMLSPIISALDRVELLTYAYEIEYVCSLFHLNKIDRDAAETTIRLLTDLQLYNTMMGREVNFRPKDLSSVFSNAKPLRYFSRLFSKGDRDVPNKVANERPILHFTTHHLLGFSEPIFSALGKRVVFIELVRHPLYMVKQNHLNMENLVCCDLRDFTIYYSYGDKQLPYYVRGWEEIFLAANPTERAIYYNQKLAELTENRRNFLRERMSAKVVTIPFERFVVDPWPYMEQIERALDTKVTSVTRKMMKKQRVPRKMIADGINLRVYKRYAWQPAKFKTEQEELVARRQFAAERASVESMHVLDQLCSEYESKYLENK